MSKKIVVNGRFLTQRVTGVQRYAMEIVRELDKLCDNTDAEIRLAVPKNTVNELDLKNIKTVTFGRLTGEFWEQISYPMYLFKEGAEGLCLANVVPLLKPDCYAVIHDISYKVNPQFFRGLHSKLSRLWHVLQYSAVCRFARHIFTVSEFSKKEIKNRYHVSDAKITVVYNSWQHFGRENADDSLLERFESAKSGEYYFAMATVSKSKNFKWVIEVAKNNPECKFLIAGYLDPKRFGESLGVSELNNIHFLGYVSDAEAKTLMKNCKAFLFPTLYEGFGLPPIEALSIGANIVVSDIEIMRELYDGCAYFIDPYDYNVDLTSLLCERIPTSSANEVLQRFEWSRAANTMVNVLRGGKR
jgi:glycosyltransferase involved in cell wall biosynthesis